MTNKLTGVFLALVLSGVLRGEDLPLTHREVGEAARIAALRAWKLSLVPMAASQGLDAASSYGMRELNPLLASSNGGFEGKAVSVKLGFTAAAIGIEYLIVRHHPGAAKVLAKVNWASSALTAGFAAHNFAIK